MTIPTTFLWWRPERRHRPTALQNLHGFSASRCRNGATGRHRHADSFTCGMPGGGTPVAGPFTMTHSYTPRQRRLAAVRRPRDPSITSLGFTMFRFEGPWPVEVIRSRNAMAALRSL
jgi:hypothetical protein